MADGKNEVQIFDSFEIIITPKNLAGGYYYLEKKEADSEFIRLSGKWIDSDDSTVTVEIGGRAITSPGELQYRLTDRHGEVISNVL